MPIKGVLFDFSGTLFRIELSGPGSPQPSPSGR